MSDFEKEKERVIDALAKAGIDATPHPYTPTGLWIALHHRESARKILARFPGWIVDHRGHAFKPVK